MESFVEERLDLGILYGTDGGPGFKTDIVVMASGNEDRNIGWAQERGRWELGDRQLLRAKLEYILEFFRARRGRAIGFRWKNWGDYTLTAEVIGTGDGIVDAYQIIQTSDTGFGTAYVRDITKIVTGTVTVYFDSVETTSNFTIDYDTGIITWGGSFEPGVGVVITVDCEFDIPVRFDVDTLPQRFDGLRESDNEVGYYLPPLPIIEVRP